MLYDSALIRKLMPVFTICISKTHSLMLKAKNYVYLLKLLDLLSKLSIELNETLQTSRWFLSLFIS